jgi:hypothetical protein
MVPRLVQDQGNAGVPCRMPEFPEARASPPGGMHLLDTPQP